MDTYRVQLPQPQPIENEDEFVTNSGRKMKRPNVEHEQEINGGELKLTGGEDVNTSGVSVLSPDSLDKEFNQNGQLSDSVQAELHLSLDRLSGNFDPGELRKLQEKSKRSNASSRQSEQKRISSRRNNTLKLPDDHQIPTVTAKQITALSEDSLDTEMERTPIPVELDVSTSEEFVVSGDDDRTVVADSLNYQSFGDGVTAMSSAHSSKKSGASDKRSREAVNHVEDQYADLRYNPNFRKEHLEKPEASTHSALDHLHDIHQVDDSLEETEPQNRNGGAIVIHRKGLYSPVIPKWGDESALKSSSRSLSPTRLSADPVKLQLTNALYEEEFNKMLKAEILNNPTIPEETENHRDQQPMSQDSEVPRTESYSVLIRRIEQQDKKYPSEEPIRIGGYQLLPDRHRIPSPGRGMNMSNPPEMVVKKHRTPKKLMTPTSYQPPDEYLYNGKKDPLVAISPREKKKVSIAPTPPRIPKPKDIDYVELNKQRLSRKTNSAGYLDLHRKRSRQSEVLESRSQSEIKRSTIQQSPRQLRHNDPYPPAPADEYPPGSLEELWARQVERLKAAKNQNVNQGKVMRQRPKPQGYSQVAVMDSSATGSQSERDRIEEGRQWQPYFQQFSIDGVNPIALLQNSGNMKLRQPLPIPSQTAAQFSPQHFNRPPQSNGYLVDPATSNQYMYYSPRIRPVEDQESPLLRAYEARYAADVYQPRVINDGSGNILRQNVNERNIIPQSEREPDVWMNSNNHPEDVNEYMSQISSKFARRVTFVGDNEPVAIEGLDEFSSTISGSGYGLNRYKVPLPPTPPSKSQRHAVQRMKVHPEEKENDAGYYDVREDGYPVLPPILKPSKESLLKQSPNGENEPKNTDDNGSYFEQYEKEKSRKRFQYKIYTLNDYKNMKKDVKLGGLGPDMESARKKMQKADRAKQYAEIIRKEHMSNDVIKKKQNIYETRGDAAPGFDEKHHFSATMDEKQRKDMLERRTRAIEYSKRVPKPKTKPVMNLSQRSEIDSDLSNNTPDMQHDSSSPEGVNFNYGLLEMMKERHEKEKAQVATFAGNG